MCKKLISMMIVAVLLSLSFGVESAEAARLKKGPYLIYPGTNTQMTVLWQLNGTTSCTLEWGLDTSYSDGNTVTTEYASDHQHKFTILSLTPGSKYYYRVTVDSNIATGSFLAAPATSATDVKLMAYGDTRNNPDIHDSVDANMVDTYQADANYQSIVLHSGDWVSSDSEDNWASHWFDPNWVNSHEIQLNVPFHGCWGNHEDAGVVYEKYYPYPYVNEQYWSFDYGPVHISVLDQSVDYTSGSAQYNWLVNDLSGTDREWLIILLHKPGWSAGRHSNDQDVQNYIQPLCVQYGVDIVFAGHNHYYARTTVEGVKHVTTGAGGAPLYSPNAKKVEVAAKAYHFCKVDIAGNQLDYSAVDIDKVEIDSFTLIHQVDTTPPEPDPMTWATLPYATGDSSIAMVATTATDTSGVEYLFDCITAGGHDSNWQDNSDYEDTNLNPSTPYSYRVQARDKSPNQNATAWSTTETATTQAVDTTPPEPDPMTWATVPYATGPFSIAMVATTATDVSGVEYYFDCTTVGGHDSNWQDNSDYEDTGLDANTPYTYSVQARDKSANQNATGWSTSETATTEVPGPVIFSDGFESGDFVYSGWITSGDTATVASKAAYTGSYGVKLAKESWIEKAASTAGYTDIHIKYVRKTYGLDPGEEFYARWHDGDTWHILETTLDENWVEKDWTLGSTANNNPDFKIKFSSNGGHPSQEYSCLDVVEVSGTP